jgi:hypothetical protein
MGLAMAVARAVNVVHAAILHQTRQRRRPRIFTHSAGKVGASRSIVE